MSGTDDLATDVRAAAIAMFGVERGVEMVDDLIAAASDEVASYGPNLAEQSEPTYEQLRAEVERFRSCAPQQQDFDVAAYIGAKVEEARQCAGVIDLGDKNSEPTQYHPGAWVLLTDLPTMSTPQSQCHATAPHGPHYWQLVRQTTAPDGPVSLCLGVSGAVLLAGEVQSNG